MVQRDVHEKRVVAIMITLQEASLYLDLEDGNCCDNVHIGNVRIILCSYSRCLYHIMLI